MEKKSEYNIIQVLEKQAEAQPSSIALSYKGKEMSYADLWTAIRNKATELSTKGIQKGDRVLVFVPFSIDLYISLQAVFYVGAVAVFVDQWAKLSRLNICCEMAQCRGFLYNTKTSFLRILSKGIRHIPIKINAKPRYAGKTAPIQDMHPDDEALITFTTGSTGIPKAAIRTHSILQAQFDSLSEKIGSDHQTVSFIGLPIVVLCELGVGAQVCLENIKVKNLNKKEVLKQEKFLLENKVDVILHSPFYIRALCDLSDQKLPHIKRILTGGAPIYPNDAREIKSKFPNAKFTTVFGSTEAEPISSISANKLINSETELERNGLKVGAIHPICTLKIIKRSPGNISVNSLAEFKGLELKEGIGEIIVAGQHVVQSYLANEKAFEENKIVVGDTIWHRTGDAGQIIDGQLYLLGRQKELFEKDGQLISPFISEYVLAQMPNIKEGTIIKVNDKIVCFVSSSDEVASQIKSKFPYVDKVIIMSDLPKDPRHNSKIDYGKLRE